MTYRPHSRRLYSSLAAGLSLSLGLMSTSVVAATGVGDLASAPRAMLVMDGSNSMWGQIDGIAKITIAQDVVRELLQDLPGEMALGLTAYGHRTAGDCRDVEVMVDPGLDNRDAIVQELSSIKPRGKTPMAEAVRQAAQALGNSEAPATVILVSDGVETCAHNVCAIADELERTGVDFTTHVIGFDVKEEEAINQFSCMAKATGGQYLSVDTATELSAALIATTQFESAAVPEPTITALPLITESGRLYFSASHKMDGTLQNMPAHWQLEDTSGNAIMTGYHNSGGHIDLKPGEYRLIATDTVNGHTETRSLRVTDRGTMQVTLLFP